MFVEVGAGEAVGVNRDEGGSTSEVTVVGLVIALENMVEDGAGRGVGKVRMIVVVVVVVLVLMDL